MSAPKPRLDIDRTRDRLVALGCTHAAERLDEVLSEAVRQEIAAHAFLDRLLHRAHVLTVKGPSYRLGDLEDALKLAYT